MKRLRLTARAVNCCFQVECLFSGLFRVGMTSHESRDSIGCKWNASLSELFSLVNKITVQASEEWLRDLLKTKKERKNFFFLKRRKIKIIHVSVSNCRRCMFLFSQISFLSFPLFHFAHHTPINTIAKSANCFFVHP